NAASAASGATQQVQARRSGSDEQQAEEVADCAADDRGLHDQRDADPDEDDRERGGRDAVRSHAALRPAATMTRHGACFRTKSTVSLNTSRRATSPRGAPITMISE